MHRKRVKLSDYYIFSHSIIYVKSKINIYSKNLLSHICSVIIRKICLKMRMTQTMLFKMNFIYFAITQISIT